MDIRIGWDSPGIARNKPVYLHRVKYEAFFDLGNEMSRFQNVYILHGNSFIKEGVWRLMKYKYCQNCKKAYIRSRLEKNNCIYCGQPCETVDVKRNGIYYYGYAVMILGAGSVLVPRFTVVSDSTTYLVVGIVLAFVGSVFVMMGSTKMAKTAAVMVADSEEPDSEDNNAAD